MTNYLSAYCLNTNPVTRPQNIYIHNSFRFSVITPKLLRIENDTSGKFCDEPTQSVINRNFDECSCKFDVKDNNIIITTDKSVFTFSILSEKLVSVKLYDGRIVTDFRKGNLKGTKRTLDNVNGKTELEDGIISVEGVAVLDDSTSLLLKNDGKVLPRENSVTDTYYFCYGFDYKDAVRDLFNLTGNAPLIPRFTLGNWWSRYKAYTQSEYTELMKEFITRKIPITVATIDMDWHWVNVVKKFGMDALDDKNKSSVLEFFYNSVFPGWTGYSWNTELFPDPKSFLKWLKDNDLHITMNLHPASGCKFYEDAYEDFCEFMGIDKNSKKQIRFDITDEKFIEGYFKFLHHPHEADGVDFWWIDWQQGTNSAVKGLDPLWALNHYHSLDLKIRGKRPLILSRFAGAGSHRYPLGFSGDTVQTWESLDFQPYFTNTASNIGYSWWSHDIGGHCRGYRDDELYLRWLQYGVFSPIMRLHSTSNEFMGKEPWKYDKFTEITSAEFMRLRHRMIPYIYSMNRRTYADGRCLIEPMYYNSPKDERAYKVPNQYYFGSELIVCPITEPCNCFNGLAETKAFLPKGRYIDIFNGRVYNGNCLTSLFRDKATIPVLAKEGAIIPLYADADSNSIKNPEKLEILITKGNNTFTLYEDDGETLDYINGAYTETVFENIKKNGVISFKINAASGAEGIIPENRSYSLSFIDIALADEISVVADGESIEYIAEILNGHLYINIPEVSTKKTVIVTVYKFKGLKNRSKRELKIELISKIRGSNDKKTLFYSRILKSDCNSLLPTILKRQLDELDNMIY